MKAEVATDHFHIDRQERLYLKTLHLSSVFGRPNSEMSYTKRFLRVRWHLVDGLGQCLPAGDCGDKTQAACGWTYRRQARARLHELTGRWS